MKVLVPCDFSPISNHAASYALHMAKALSAEVILLHIIHFEHPPMVQISESIEQQFKERQIADGKEACSHLIKKLCSDVEGIKISSKVISGFPVAETIEQVAHDSKANLIIMGTRGATGFKKMLFGSNAVALIRKSSLPVITVGEGATFAGIKQIIYASDLKQVEDEIEELIPIAKPFKASITILHITPSSTQQAMDKKVLQANLNKKYGNQNIKIEIRSDANPLRGIDQFVQENKGDLLVMFRHENSFLEHLFGLSLTEEEAFKHQIPLLTLKKKNA